MWTIGTAAVSSFKAPIAVSIILPHILVGAFLFNGALAFSDSTLASLSASVALLSLALVGLAYRNKIMNKNVPELPENE